MQDKLTIFVIAIVYTFRNIRGEMPTHNWMRAALRDKGYKLKDVAEVLKVPAPRITDILKGTRGVQSSEIVPLADLLGLSPRSLLKSLKVGELTVVPGDGRDMLPILGCLFGDGHVGEVPPELPFDAVPVPPDAQSNEGLYCYVMGDNSMAKEIAPDSLVIAADPRQHFFPMVPNALFLVDLGEERRALRQYVKTEGGGEWLVPLPEFPDPSFKSWRFSMLPKDLVPKDSSVSNGGTENGDQRTLYTDDILAAVLWVHRRHMPRENR